MAPFTGPCDCLGLDVASVEMSVGVRGPDQPQIRTIVMTGVNVIRLCDAEMNKALKVYLTQVVLKDEQLTVTSVRYNHSERITEVTLEGTEK